MTSDCWQHAVFRHFPGRHLGRANDVQNDNLTSRQQTPFSLQSLIVTPDVIWTSFGRHLEKPNDVPILALKSFLTATHFVVDSIR